MEQQSNLTNVVAVFDTHQAAQRAVERLLAGGIEKDNVSVLANMGATDTEEHTKSKTESVSGGLTSGITWGGLGGLALGLLAFATPGVLVAGPLALAIAAAGAGVGAIGGGVVGAMNQLGVPDEHANMYNEAVQRGGTVVAVMAAGNQIEMVKKTLTDSGALNVNEHQSTPQRSGWQEVHSAATPNAEPPSPGNQVV